MSKNCKSCGYPIPEQRLKALPTATTCVSCSNVEKKAGFMVYDHKTAPVINITDQETAAKINQMSKRSGGQGVLSGVKFKD